MRTRKLMLSQVFVAAFFALSPTVCFSEQECSIEFSLISDTGATVENASMSAVELPNGTKISTNPAGLVQQVTVPLPDNLYRKVEVVVNHEDYPSRTEAGSIAFYNLWPCSLPYKTTLTLSARTGVAAEVRTMWDSKDFVTPSDFASAALQYAQALATAQARLEANPNSKNQYDLISTYLALRAFNNLNKFSNIPLAHSGNLSIIAIWHRNLLTKVNQDGLETIFEDGSNIASERLALRKMYKDYWQQTLAIEDHAIVLERLTRFRKAINSESNSDELLGEIGLSRSELMASINSYAGKVVKQNADIDKVLRFLITEQVEATEQFLKSESVLEKDKLSADVEYLSQKIAE